MAQMFDEIMQNMEKELIQQRGKVNQAGQQRQIIGRRLEILEQNLAENKVVMMELCKWPKISLLRYLFQILWIIRAIIR